MTDDGKIADWTLDVKDAIEIAKILAKAPEERLPLIFSVFEKADLTLEGLEELEAWAVNRDGNAVLELSEFMSALAGRFPDKVVGDEYRIRPAEFAEFCRERGMNLRAVKQWLSRKGMLVSSKEGTKTSYTKTIRDGTKSVRVVCIRKEANADAEKIGETAEGN